MNPESVAWWWWLPVVPVVLWASSAWERWRDFHRDCGKPDCDIRRNPYHHHAGGDAG